MNELRRSKRKLVEQTIQVTDAMSGAVMGRIGNLSIDGMMLIANQELREDALFQVLFHLPGEHGHSVTVEVGMHEQWTEPGAAPGQYWAGFRIIDIAPRDFEVLKKWIDDDAAR